MKILEKPPSLVIFDCDGVLVDSEALAAQAFAEELAQIGLPWTVSDLDMRFRGLSLRDCLSLVEREWGPLPDAFLTGLNARTYERFERDLRAVPGVHLVVEALVRAKIPYCVASSGSHEKMRLTLGLTGLLPFFEGRLFSADQVARGKPAPDLFLFAAREIGIPIDHSVVIEDSLPGAQAGVSAGARVLGFCPSIPAESRELSRSQVRSAQELLRHRETLAKWGVFSFASMSDLPHLLGIDASLGD